MPRCASTTPRRWPTSGRLYGDRLVYCDRPYGALERADALAIVTEWKEFRNPDFEVMARLLRQPVIFDGRNLYDPARMAARASPTTASAAPRFPGSERLSGMCLFSPGGATVNSHRLQKP